MHGVAARAGTLAFQPMVTTKCARSISAKRCPGRAAGDPWQRVVIARTATRSARRRRGHARGVRETCTAARALHRRCALCCGKASKSCAPFMENMDASDGTASQVIMATSAPHSASRSAARSAWRPRRREDHVLTHHRIAKYRQRFGSKVTRQPPPGAERWPSKVLQRWYEEGGRLSLDAFQSLRCPKAMIDDVGTGLPIVELEPTVAPLGGLLGAISRGEMCHFDQLASAISCAAGS